MAMPNLKELLLEPKESTRRVNDDYSRKYINRLFILGGYPVMFNLAIVMQWGRDLGLPSVLFLILITGPVFGFLVYNIATGLLFMTGRIMNGESQYHGVKTALGISLTPTYLLVVLYVILLFVFGKGIFIEDLFTFESNNLTTQLFLIFNMLQIGIIIYTFGVLVMGIAQVQDFPTWKAAVNLLITLFILSIVLYFGSSFMGFMLSQYPF